MSLAFPTPRKRGDVSATRPAAEARRAAPSGEFLLTLASAAAVALCAGLRLSPDVVDHPTSAAVDSIAQTWPALDFVIRTLDQYSLFQGGLVLAIGAAALVKAGDQTTRMRLLIGGFAAGLAAVLSRALQLFLPHSPRPMFDPGLHWTAPYGSDIDTLRDWSSFPSDHASLLFGVAFAITVANRRLGTLALAVACCSGFVRIYEGEHYLCDVLGGAWLAVFTVLAALQVARPFQARLNALAARHAGLIAVAAFIFFTQASTLFDDVRELATTIAKHL